MTNKQILYRFLKNNDLLKNKIIIKHFKSLNNIDSLNDYKLFNFFNNCCSWVCSTEGRLYWETLHAQLFLFASQFINVTKDSVRFFTNDGYFTELKRKNKTLYQEVCDKKENIINI